MNTACLPEPTILHPLPTSPPALPPSLPSVRLLIQSTRLLAPPARPLAPRPLLVPLPRLSNVSNSSAILTERVERWEGVKSKPKPDEVRPRRPSLTPMIPMIPLTPLMSLMPLIPLTLLTSPSSAIIASKRDNVNNDEVYDTDTPPRSKSFIFSFPAVVVPR